MKVLVIEDDPTVGNFVRRGLEEQRWGVQLVADGEEGERLATSDAYDVVILDMRLPGKSGMDVLNALRARGFERPVLVLTAQDALDAKVNALRAGADDYVTKPFSTAELLARLRAAQRRAQPREETSVFMHEGLVVDLTARTVTRDGAEVKLTGTEWALLALLIRHAGRVITHRQILREIWGPNAEEHREYLRVYFTHLRKKVEPIPAKPRLIVNEPGIGYRLKV